MFSLFSQNNASLYLFVLPVILGQVLALLFVPSMLKSGAQTQAIGRAVYSYIGQSVGILLMAAAALPTFYAVLARDAYPNSVYIAFLFVFAFGGMTFLWHDYLSSTVDPTSRQVPFLIHFYTWKLVGLLLLLFSSLSLVLQVVFVQGGLEQAVSWELHLVSMIFGLALCWCTALPRPTTQRVALESPAFSSQPIAGAQRKSAKKKAK